MFVTGKGGVGKSTVAIALGLLATRRGLRTIVAELASQERVQGLFREDGGEQFRELEVEEWCKRAFEGLVKDIKRVEKEDLSMPNHLTGYRRTFLQLSFANVNDLLAVRKGLGPIVEKNKKNVKGRLPPTEPKPHPARRAS